MVEGLDDDRSLDQSRLFGIYQLVEVLWDGGMQFNLMLTMVTDTCRWCR